MKENKYEIKQQRWLKEEYVQFLDKPVSHKSSPVDDSGACFFYMLCNLENRAEFFIPKLGRSQQIEMMLVFALLLSVAGGEKSEQTICPVPTQPFFSNNPVCLFHPLNRVEWNGISALDTTDHLVACGDKEIGAVGGKTCYFRNENYCLKAINNLKVIGDGAKAHNGLWTIYGSKFINQVLDIEAPEVQVFFIKNGTFKDTGKSEFFTATKWDKQFTSFAELLGTNSIDLISGSSYREEIVKQVGEKGLAQFLVVGTFFDDIIQNPANIGFKNGKLVVIDADLPYAVFACQHDQVEEGYYFRMLHNFGGILLGQLNMSLSLKNIQEMLNSYKKIKDKMLPKVHKEVDLSKQTFTTIVNEYIKACERTINSIKQFPKINKKKPELDITKILVHEFANFAGKVRITKKDPQTRKKCM